jgi:hypothetical protein
VRSDALAVTGRRENGPAAQTVVHRCPVCDARHEVSAARAQLAYGRQLCCGPDCEGARRRRARGACRRIVPA